LLASLKKKGVDVIYVTLHVNMGTFASLTDENMKTGKLHREEYEITPAVAKFLTQAKKERRPIIAVGTTVVRTLESAQGSSGKISKLSGGTDLFIREGCKFKMVDGMITNFHVPKSSLLMLVSAFAGREKIMRAYKQAIAQRFRLFSFGDAMLIR